MKSKSPPKTIDAYIFDFPLGVQAILQKLRRIVRDAAPDAEEAVKYRIPTFVLGENLVHFAAFENHIGFYPTPSGIRQFKHALSAYKSAKGSVQFPLNAPLPCPLIRRIVKFRVKECRQRMASTPNKKKSSKSSRRAPTKNQSPNPNKTYDHDARIAKMTFSSVYPHYLAKIEKKGRTKAELHQVIKWLTGFQERSLQQYIHDKATFEQFFQHAKLNPQARLITGVICGHRIENIENPLTQQVRYLDKLVDDLAKGRELKKILRAE